MQNLAEVLLWNERVGALVYDPVMKTSTFEYAPHWLENGVEIAPIRMKLSQRKYQFAGLNSNTYRGLPAVFADTLPDDFGNAVINAWLARNGRSTNDFTAVERLLYTGNRGMGALEFAPAIKRESADNELELASLVAMAQSVLDERAHLSKTIDKVHRNDKAMLDLFQIGTSAGGARPKAVIAINKERTEIRSGQIDAKPGFEHFLLKFDGVEEHLKNAQTFGDPKGFGRMEYAYYQMAIDAGINISYSELLLEGDRAHFITKRFDRDKNRKRHIVTLCAMDHADYKRPGEYSYEQLLSIARQLRLPRMDAIEIFRRMTFNIVAKNHDDHTKNVSFLLDSKQSDWRLSPAYDLAYSFKQDSPWVNSHQMTINGKRDNFDRDDLYAVAGLISNFSNKAADLIIDQVIDVVADWETYAKEADVFKLFAKEISKNHRLEI